jgi:sulfur-oxidizing protein SoxY
MQAGRRYLLKAGLMFTAIATIPRSLLAAAWPEAAFKSSDASSAMTELFGAQQPTPSDQITLDVPTIAENGAVVPVEVSTTLEGVESISIVVDNNPRPLAAMFELAPEVVPAVESRIKMGQTSNVTAVVKTGEGLFSVTKEVKVTIGGCGG